MKTKYICFKGLKDPAANQIKFLFVLRGNEHNTMSQPFEPFATILEAKFKKIIIKIIEL